MKSVEALSTITTTLSSAGDLLELAQYVELYSKRGRIDTEAWAGIDRDSLKDLAESLTNAGESYGGGGWEADEDINYGDE